MPLNITGKIAALLAATLLMGQPPLARADDPIHDLKKFGNSLFGGGSNSSKKDDPPVTNTNQQEDSQEDSGIGKIISGAIGAGLGGYLGSKFGGGKGKTLATIVGVAAGAWLGSELAKSWSEADQAALNRTSAGALNNTKDGQTVTWKNPDTGATATITPTATRYETRKVTIVRTGEIQSPPPFDVIGETYVAKKSSNMRAGPSTKISVVGNLRAGQTFTAIGKITGADWIIVGQNGRTVGYVLSSLVTPQQTINVSTQAGSSSENQVRIRPVKSAKIVKSEISSNGGIDLDAEGIVVEEVTATASCRATDLTVSDTQSGKSETSSFKACKAADGAWEIM